MAHDSQLTAIHGPIYVTHALRDTWAPRKAGRVTTQRDALLRAIPGLANVFKTLIVRTSRSTYDTPSARAGYFEPLRNTAEANGLTLIASADSPQAALWKLLDSDHAPKSGPADWNDWERSIERASISTVPDRPDDDLRGGPVHLDMERCLWADAKNNNAAAWNEIRTFAVASALRALNGAPLLWYHPHIHPDTAQQAAYNRLTAALLQVIRFRTDDVLLDANPWLYQKPNGGTNPVDAAITTINMYHRAGFEPRRVYLGMISDHAGGYGYSPAEFHLIAGELRAAAMPAPPSPTSLPPGTHERLWYFGGDGRRIAAHAAAFGNG